MSSGDSLGIIPTKAMLLRSGSASEFTATVFEERKHHREERKRKKNIDHNHKSTERVPKDEESVFDIRKARNEVLKLGLSGFEEVEKKKAQVEMAVKLGAKPAKREYKNYKVLQEERKLAKEAQEQQQSLQNVGKKATGEALFSYKKFTRGHRKRKGDSEVLKEYGRISADKLSALTTKKRKT
ncbi:uncharacterized protein C1orf131 [Phlebotomus argentipes]|uniref:uncharacterized protein C1orf131 n=1 Tax=Phlebotomus argentipes TaxID=94469 RepID=UPI0028938225|nr:uncharacterized protein C1orf131 [Phlebotomus argentipes]